MPSACSEHASFSAEKNFLCAIFSDGAKNNAQRFYGLFDGLAKNRSFP